LIPCKNVQLHCAWCRCNHLCCHPWWVSSVPKPKWFLCLFMFEIQVPSFVYNQISGSSWSAMYSPHPGDRWHHKNRGCRTNLFHQHKLHLPTFSSLLQLSHQCKGSQNNFCQV
jgi:hypothetical protein